MRHHASRQFGPADDVHCGAGCLRASALFAAARCNTGKTPSTHGRQQLPPEHGIVEVHHRSGTPDRNVERDALGSADVSARRDRGRLTLCLLRKLP